MLWLRYKRKRSVCFGGLFPVGVFAVVFYRRADTNGGDALFNPATSIRRPTDHLGSRSRQPSFLSRGQNSSETTNQKSGSACTLPLRTPVERDAARCIWHLYVFTIAACRNDEWQFTCLTADVRPQSRVRPTVVCFSVTHGRLRPKHRELLISAHITNTVQTWSHSHSTTRQRDGSGSAVCQPTVNWNHYPRVDKRCNTLPSNSTVTTMTCVIVVLPENLSNWKGFLVLDVLLITIRVSNSMA